MEKKMKKLVLSVLLLVGVLAIASETKMKAAEVAPCYYCLRKQDCVTDPLDILNRCIDEACK